MTEVKLQTYWPDCDPGGIVHFANVFRFIGLAEEELFLYFFICIEDLPSLYFGGDRNPDGQGFAAFGKVIDGMEVVRAIQRAPVEEQRLTPPVDILSIERLQ